MPGTFTVVDLFCGCGGLSLGFQQAGFQILAAVDISRQRVDWYRQNTVSHAAYQADLSALSVESLLELAGGAVPDVLMGAPPSTPFAPAGYERGSRDPRDAIPQFVRLALGIRPPVILLDTIEAFWTSKKWLDYRTSVLQGLEGGGYRLQHRLQNAADYGVPQNRVHGFLLAIRNDKGDGGWAWPAADSVRKTIGDAISDLVPSLPETDLPPWLGKKPFPEQGRLVVSGKNDNKWGPQHKLFDEACFTLTESAGGRHRVRDSHGQWRKFTEDCFRRIQGLPDHCRGDFAALASATPPPLGRAIADAVRLGLEGHRSEPTIAPSVKPQEEPILISFFAGPGGLDVGFAQAGFRTLLATDVDEAAVRTHRHNHPDADALQWDLSAVTPEILIDEWNRRTRGLRPLGVIGGPPCQSFSISNSAARADDHRHELPFHYANLLKALNIHYSVDFFVFENVVGVLQARHRERWRRICDRFRDAGFDTYVEILNAVHFGVPQSRKRVFLVGLNRERFGHVWFQFPTGHGPQRTVQDALVGLEEPVPFSPTVPPEAIPIHPNHWHMVPRSDKFGTDRLEPSRTGKSFKVLRWERPSYAVAYGNREVHIHPSGKRRLSVYEAMLLQGFPDTYRLLGSLSDQIRLVSEAVPPPLARAVARAISDQLGYLVHSRNY